MKNFYFVKIQRDHFSDQGYTNCGSLAAGLRENGERMRKWRGNGERMMKWRGNGERFTLYISSFSFYFLPLYPFPITKMVSLCRKIRHEKKIWVAFAPESSARCDACFWQWSLPSSTLIGIGHHQHCGFVDVICQIEVTQCVQVVWKFWWHVG